jgi:dipeptidyl aminopeptidase/acylaminoacyl peptidase
MSGTKHALALLLVIANVLCIGTASAQKNRNAQLTIEQLIEIRHPSNPVWSPDGQRLGFIWDRAGVSNLYAVKADGTGQPTALTSFPDGNISSAFWSHAGNALYFSKNGDLWQVAVAGGEAKPVWTTPTVESDFTMSRDGRSLAFVRVPKEASSRGPQVADLVVRSLSDGTDSVVAHDEVSIESPRWSPDGSHLSYIGGSRIIHHDQSPAYSGEKLIFSVEEYKPGQLFVIAATGGAPVQIGQPGYYDALAWVDNGHLVFARQSDQYKKRTIYLADASNGSLKTIHEDVEKQFWSLPDWEAGTEPQPSPDGRWIAFLTDQDGWDHLYIVASAGGDPIQITKGHFETWRPEWSHDSTRIAFDANEADHPGDRRLGIATLGGDPAHAKVEYLTAARGTDVEPHWSADDTRLVYQHTDTRNSADLYVVDAKPTAKTVRLSDSMPPDIDRTAFVEPQFVHYPGPGGQPVPAWLFVPKNFDRSKKHPAIVWIHGDGINQNYDGWHVQRNYAVYYSFHQYLLQQGYVVLAPDYRGSIGYGRDWRNGVYMDVGGKDAQDAWMAANYLKTLPYVDSQRMGVWGLSYGGFFTLIAMTDQPTLFRAGVDVAGVVDYVMYYNDPYHGDWTEERMGTPEQNPQVYAQASPISHIDRLARPLLVLHGTADVNVPFLESVWLLDEALKKQKGDLVQFMMYPGEFHYFTREHVLRDAWHRVDRFFATQLQDDAERKMGP